MLAVVGSMYGFGAKHGLVPEGMNPAHGIERYSEDGRERFLSTEELVKLGAAIRKAEKEGIAWDVDEAKPTSSTFPRRSGGRSSGRTRLRLSACYFSLVAACAKSCISNGITSISSAGCCSCPTARLAARLSSLNAPALAVLNGLERVGPRVAGEKPTSRAPILSAHGRW